VLGIEYVMRFFTFEWATGDESESDPIKDYNRFLSSLNRSDPVYLFATSISLNDALLDRVHFNSTKRELTLLLLTGDLQVGYWRTELCYTDVSIYGQDVLTGALNNRPTEVWYDEFASNGDRLSHNFLLAPDSLSDAKAEEFGIEFTSFAYVQHPTS